MRNKIKLDGVIPPVITVFKVSDFSLDTEKQAKHVDFLIRNGVHAVFPLGTAGEFAMLDREERKTVVETSVNTTNHRVPVMAGVSDPSTLNVIKYAKDAEDAGADVVLATPPYYFLTNDQGLYNHYKMVSESVSIPVLVYNIPSWTHLPVSPELFAKLVEDEIVSGAKFTTNDLSAFMDFLNAANGEVPVLIGTDTLVYSALDIGANGAIIAVSNVVPKESSVIYEKMKAGKLSEAKEAQELIMPLAKMMGVGTFPAPVKEMLLLMGRNVGPVRPPLVSLSGEERKRIEGAVQEYREKLPQEVKVR